MVCAMGKVVSVRGCCNIMVVLVLAAATKAAARLHLVGEQEGWTLPPASSGQLNYTSWVRQRTFHVGDTLVFQYHPDLHDVLQVEKDSYAACNVTAPLSSFSDGNTTITLDQGGVWYFVCGTLDHCSLGQKVALTCLDPVPDKHSPTANNSSSKSPFSTPPSTSIPSFSSSPSTPFLDPSPSTSNTPYFNPTTPPTSNTPYFDPTTPPTSNTPYSAYYPPFVNPPPLIPPIDPSSPSSWGPKNVPPPFDSPPSSSNPCEHQFSPPPAPLVPSPSTPTSNLSPPPSSSNSPNMNLTPKTLLQSLTLGVSMTFMAYAC